MHYLQVPHSLHAGVCPDVLSSGCVERVCVLQWYDLINEFALTIFHLNSTLCLHTCIVIAMWFRTHGTITKIEYICHSKHLITISAFDPLQYINPRTS